MSGPRAPRETSKLLDPRFDDDALGNNANHSDTSDFGGYRVYNRRWFMVGVLGLLNFSNALSWLSFSPVANRAAEYYDVKSSQIDWLSTVFMIVCLPVGFLAIYILDTFGLRSGIIIGATTNFLGLGVRYLSTFDFIPTDQHIPFIITFVGQSFCAIGQPFLMFAPTKLAALWFAGDQRAVANMMATMLNPLGLLGANILSPLIVKHYKDIPLMLLVYMIPGAVVFVLSVFGVCSSVPPTPPSASAAQVHETFLQGLKKIVRIKPYIILCINFGAGFGLLSALLTVLQQVLCVRGYSDTFSGYCGAAMIGCGIVASFFSGLYVDKTKKFEEVTKIFFSLAIIAFMIFSVISTFSGMEDAIFACCVLFGTFGLAQYPIGLELGVECTYPVAEATSAGLIALSGQVQGIIFMLFNVYLPSEEISSNQTCTDDKYEKVNDLTRPLLICSGYITFTCIMFVTFFKTKYLRLEAEQRCGANNILNYNTVANYRHQPVND
ncbi:solute carrier family 49 member A3-like [Anneissia japonica]|uniref:solute carrier family 49 member A3-like n=1 Tax=Anneissia japonica TaxID=1529436 RepID=UPI0014256587|nr:solute carrier family 49 member A3-like [Anneissia japonica]